MRAIKADDEQNFYVTGKSFSKDGTLKCTSYQRNNTKVHSYTAAIKRSNPREAKGYKSKAKAGVYYYMSTTGTNGLKVTGSYTP